MHIELPSEEDAKFLGSRSVAIKGIFEPWGAGATCEECLEAAKVAVPSFFPPLPRFPSSTSLLPPCPLQCRAARLPPCAGRAVGWQA